jgi:tetratricopeptide (TPR) repeat protein
MQATPTLQKAALLIEQSRYDMAEKELRTFLTHEPGYTPAMRLLAVCLLSQGRLTDALETSGNLVGLEPDEPQNLYLHAAVLLRLDRDGEAEEYVREAIRLYPYDADYFELLARVYLGRKKWAEALQFANEGLALDPAHVNCLNVRTTALTKLNRKAEAAQTIEDVLEQDPENPYSHANVGWTKLEHGDHKGAQVHFAEALRLDPTLEHARYGMLEALKAGNFIYRGFLAFYFWLGRFQGKTQWGIIIGIYVVSRIVRAAAKSQPALMPVAVLLSVLIYSTWIIEPLFNLFMRLHPKGRYILTDRERDGANWVGALLGVGLTAAAVYLLAQLDDFLMLAVIAGTMVLPVSQLFAVEQPKAKRTIRTYTLVLAAVGLGALAGAAFNVAGLDMLFGLYLLGIFAFGWVVNAMVIK